MTIKYSDLVQFKLEKHKALQLRAAAKKDGTTVAKLCRAMTDAFLDGRAGKRIEVEHESSCQEP